MVDNPWNVDSIWAFTFLKCPECIFDTQEESIFRDHAAKNHPLSFVFFGGKKEEEEYEDDYYDNGDAYDYENGNLWLWSFQMRVTIGFFRNKVGSKQKKQCKFSMKYYSKILFAVAYLNNFSDGILTFLK